MKYLLTIIGLLFLIPTANANHIFATEIEYQCLGNSTYQVKVSLYTECGTTTLPDTLILSANSFSCSQIGLQYTLSLDTAQSGDMVTPLCANFTNQAICNGGGLPSEQVLVYLDTLQLPAECPDWILGVSPNIRSSFFTNLVNPASTNIYVEAMIDNSFGACYHSPAYRNVPMLYACAGQLYTKDMGGFDWQGDTIKYSLVAPKENATNTINFQAGLSATQPLSLFPNTTFDLDENTGQLTFTPRGGQSQVAAFVIKADKYHQGKIVASVIRELDIQSSTFCNNASLGIGEVKMLGGGSTYYDKYQKAFIGCRDSLFFKTGVRDWNGDSIFVKNTNLDSLAVNYTLNRQVVQVDSIDLVTNIATNTPLLTTTIGKPIIKIGFTDNSCPFESRRTAQFITFPHFLKVSASKDIVCANSPQVLQLGVTGTGSLTNIQWQPIGGTPSNLVVSNNSIVNPSLSLPALSGGTVLQYQVTADLGTDSCTQNISQILTIRVVENPTITKQITNASTSTDGAIMTTVNGNLTQFDYDWSSGQATGSLTNLGIGDYILTVTDYYGCQTRDTTTVTFGSSVNKLLGENMDWKIYPNPTQNKQLYLQASTTNLLSLATTVDLRLFNSLGQIIYTQTVAAQPQIRLELSTLPTGNYWLQIRTGATYVTKKIRLE